MLQIKGKFFALPGSSKKLIFLALIYGPAYWIGCERVEVYKDLPVMLILSFSEGGNDTYDIVLEHHLS